RATRDLAAAAEGPALHLEVDGRPLAPISVTGERSLFRLPRGAATVRLLSRAAPPSALRPWAEDRRRLGVCVTGLGLHDGAEWRDVPVDHPMLGEGWWAAERARTRLWRWTDGEAALTVPKGTTMLEVRLAGRMRHPRAGGADHMQAA
ncbi:MAG: hypothetical protein WBQ75_18080, partial [Acetobacteraceae bacterium]